MNRKLRAVYASLAEVTAVARLADAHPAGERKGLKVRALDAATSELQVYGEIGGGWLFGGVNAADFTAELKDIVTPNLHVRISSPGGDVFEAVAMHTALRNWSGTVTTFNDAIAASAASFLAMAGDRIVTEQGAMWMLHAASTMTHGTAADHRDSAELLDKVTDNIAEFYALRAGGEKDEWLTLLNSGDNWYTAAEALELGITDEIVTDAPADAVNARLRYVIKNYRMEGAPDVPAVEAPVPTPDIEGEEGEAAEESEADVSDDFAFGARMAHYLISGK